MIFGSGTVVDSDPQKQANVIQFDDMDTPRAISYRAKLKLLP